MKGCFKEVNHFLRNYVFSLFATLSFVLFSSSTYALNIAPDCSQASAVPNQIIPPDNRMVPIEIVGVIDPENKPLIIETQCIQQDEPVEYWRWYNVFDDDIENHDDHDDEHGDDDDYPLGRYDASGLTTNNPTIRARTRDDYYLLGELEEVESEGRVYDIIFRAIDSDGAMCSGKVNVNVPEVEDDTGLPEPVVDNGYRFPSVPDGVNCEALPINNPPIIYSQPIVEARVNAPYTYRVTGHDPDQEPLTYALVSTILGMTIDPQTGLIEWTPSIDQEGLQTVVISVSDQGGLQAIQSFEVTVAPALDELSAKIIANPVTGTSPLTVRFSPEVQNNNIVINNYAWDFNGDGITDISDTFGAPRSYTYTGVPGDIFVATLTVTPASGDPLVATQNITIQNEPPSVSVTANVTNGHAPLPITFIVNAQDPQGISSISIDYDGDDTNDEVRTLTNNTTESQTFNFTYQNEGSFSAIITVTDSYNAETRVANNAISVDVNNPLDPIVQLSATPQTGNTPLLVTFNATATLYDGSAISQWNWDLDGDGVFETLGGNGLSDTITYTYNGVNSYFPVAQVMTDSNRTAIASLLVQTQSTAVPTLSIPNASDTINSDVGQQATINVNLPLETDLSVWIENSSGLTVKTIQPPQLSSSGDYSFVWDATTEQNDIVSEGDYYVVLGYTVNGIQREIDLRDSTGGQLSYYRRTTSNPRTFNRLKQPLRIDYAVDDPAEVTFFWQISFGARLMTLMEHERMGRGQYSLYWNGEYPSGAKVSPSLNRLMPGIVRYILPSNVIYVKENPRIENFVLKSTIIADPRREPIELQVTMTKPSIVEMVVSDMDKGVDVASRNFTDIQIGAHTLLWDGKNDNGQYLAPGDYRIGIRSVDERGNRSLYWYRTQRIDY